MTTKLIVLITGANKGIGLATAGAMARAGHTVLLGARDEGRGKAAAAGLAEQGLDVRFVRLDVTDQATITAAAELVDAEHGRLDVLVNNAAIPQGGRRPPEEMPLADLRRVYETNVFGAVAVTNAMLPLLRRSPSGRIGNVSSGLGTFAFLSDPDEGFAQYATMLGYNSSKAALNAVTLIYATALRDSGIRVNALSPGFCATDLNGHTGVLSADEGGAHIARQLMEDATGVFLNENGGTYPW
ncbi:SDR family oxidoreductase [Actinomadura sp. WMMA1423]|uniref:SDR family oxidoreductase n=1 Tax=Actinomadura sp. WMMA1423 TaxID=2591108 RepID=UPI00114626EE|nr:SDR family oxidoreductase [Actinomadura sp. WMMA1423]